MLSKKHLALAFNVIQSCCKITVLSWCELDFSINEMKTTIICSCFSNKVSSSAEMFFVQCHLLHNLQPYIKNSYLQILKSSLLNMTGVDEISGNNSAAEKTPKSTSKAVSVTVLGCQAYWEEIFSCHPTSVFCKWWTSINQEACRCSRQFVRCG